MRASDADTEVHRQGQAILAADCMGKPDATGTVDRYDGRAHRMTARFYQRALEIREKVFGPKHPLVATVRENYAAV
jgi:hypothetical protein